MGNPTRRTLVAGAGAVGLAAALAGCAAYGETGVNAAAPPPAGDDPDTADPAAPLARTGDIPVGGGKVLADQKIVLTQPTAGTFRCFTAVCTHAGCIVGEVAGGTINCPCHGSRFRAEDGSVANGPAKQPLAAIAVKVTGDTISRA